MRKINTNENKRTAVFNKLKLYITFWVFLITVFSSIIFMQIHKQTALSAEIIDLNQQITEADAEEKEVQDKIESRNSDQFAEDYAHNVLGWVRGNEVLVINDNDTTDK